jgi:RimJ/RimL family protein N-acetyltransferase
MQKIGMRYEDCLRQSVKKLDKFEDMDFYGIIRNEYKKPITQFLITK